ncbi:MAG TPA: glutamate-5-semialdehyde dehydrogenase [Sediminispirochaeta sp.]|nr:glutamate-5-semialdehyde dehydrogenase [Sediminispirochaeta sp.]
MRIEEMAIQAEKAQIKCAVLSTEEKNRALSYIVEALKKNETLICEENQKDMVDFEKAGGALPLLKRLKFQDEKIAATCRGLEDVKKLPDPVGRVIGARLLDEGLELRQVTCPIGLIGMIFESRPDALVQIAGLTLKSGNAVILKGGSEAGRTNRLLSHIIAEASREAGVPEGWIQLAETREDVKEMLSLSEHIDLLIPRGSNEFVRYIMTNTSIPVLGHADGVTHMYVHSSADAEMAVELVDDSKNQYVAVCNALETLLVDGAIAARFIPALAQRMRERGTELRGCPRARSYAEMNEATEEDWRTEYLEAILSVRVVDSLDEAIEHINTYGSGHTDAIVSADAEAAEYFMNMVDSAGVFWNSSTRFADGYRYGLGAEVGISTNKIHARGPVGLDGLCIYKWKLYGQGQKVADYTGPEGRPFLHKDITSDSGQEGV